MEKELKKVEENSNVIPIQEVRAFDNTKPISIIFDENGILSNESNLPWIVKTDKKIVFQPMILSMFLKYTKNDKQTGFNYILVKHKQEDKFSIYCYEKGVYRKKMKAEFREKIRRYIPQILKTTRNVEEVFNDLVCEDRFVEESDLNANENIINFQDGILNIKTMEFLPHDPKYLCTIQIPVKYKDVESSEEYCPVFDKYMDTLCSGNKDTIDNLLKCMGLCISNVYGYRTKKALFLIGKGNTGKSQIKKLIETLLGNENISTADLKTLNDRFGGSAMYGKRLVGSGDMSYQTISELNVFKQMTGGDNISIEFKNNGFIDYTFKGFMWFNGNDLPSFGGDKGKWVYDRILPIVCKNVIEEKDMDTTLFDKMLLEKNAIVKKSLNALKKLIDDDFKFVITDEMKEKLEQYKSDNNTLLKFISECCVDTSEVKIKTKRATFFQCYNQWAKINNDSKRSIR